MVNVLFDTTQIVATRVIDTTLDKNCSYIKANLFFKAEFGSKDVLISSINGTYLPYSPTIR